MRDAVFCGWRSCDNLCRCALPLLSSRSWAQYSSSTSSVNATAQTLAQDSYIVAFGSVKDRDAVEAALGAKVAASAAAAAVDGAAPTAFTASVSNKLSNVFPGFSLKASAKALQFLASRKEVLAIIPDQVYTLSNAQGLRGGAPSDAEAVDDEHQRRLVTTDVWGLDRIDQANLPT